MFEWFKRPDYSNVVKFPEQIKVPANPYVEQPTPEEIQYSVGITNEDRIALKIGYSTLTMNKMGCENLIEQLDIFVKQLKEKEDDA